MRDDLDPAERDQQLTTPPSHGRILVILAVLGIAGGIAGMIFQSVRFGLALMLGSGLAFANYYWLKSSLRSIFAAAEHGERPRMLAGNYFVRYIILGLVVAVIYAGGLLPIIPLIFGMAGFGLAVVIEGILRIFNR